MSLFVRYFGSISRFEQFVQPCQKQTDLGYIHNSYVKQLWHWQPMQQLLLWKIYYFRQIKVYLSYFLKWHYVFLLFHYDIGIQQQLTLQIPSTDQTFLLKVHYWILQQYLGVFDLEVQVKQSNAKKIILSFSILCFDFITASKLKRLAWSAICQILWSFISLRSIEATSLKYFDKDNPTIGFKGAFLYFKQKEQFPISSINLTSHCFQFRML